jgi:antitoxin component YwqK of YwqJK toxin-antitoxin module
MNQFTSSLDFSLTKKRLRMMGKRISTLRKFSLWALLIPIITGSALMFCTRTPDEPEVLSWPEIVAIASTNNFYNIELYCDGDCYTYHPLHDRSGIWYGPDDRPYNGERKQYTLEKGLLISNQSFENGKVIRSEHFYEGTSDWRVLINYLIYENGDLISQFYTNLNADDLYQNRLVTENHLEKHEQLFYSNGQLMADWTTIKTDENSEAQYHGLRTSYNVDGSIQLQELFTNGELIEKIN